VLTLTDHTDLGMLIAFAVQPTVRPGRSTEYQRVLGRYRSEVDFRAATDAVLGGLGARALSDGEFGLVLGVDQESPFAFRFADLPYTASREGRLMAGLVMVALAAWAFPTPSELEDERPRHVPDVEFEAWLRGTCEQLRVRDGSGEPIPEEGLDEAWRTYVAMPSTLVGDKGRGAGRLSPKCSLYWVRNVLSWLTEQGMARQDPGSPEGAWVLTERFRVNVKDMAGEPAYRFLAGLARGEGLPSDATAAPAAAGPSEAAPGRRIAPPDDPAPPDDLVPSDEEDGLPEDRDTRTGRRTGIDDEDTRTDDRHTGTTSELEEAR